MGRAAFAVAASVLLFACEVGGEGPRVRDSAGRAALVLEPADSNRPVGLAVGGLVSVRLPSGGESGPRWRLATPPRASVLEVEGMEYRPPADGTPRGIELWTFRAVGAGTVSVEMVLGGEAGPPLEEFVLIVSVT